MNKTEIATQITEEMWLSCYGGCGSGLGFFVVLGVVGSVTIYWILIYILISQHVKEKLK